MLSEMAPLPFHSHMDTGVFFVSFICKNTPDETEPVVSDLISSAWRQKDVLCMQMSGSETLLPLN